MQSVKTGHRPSTGRLTPWPPLFKGTKWGQSEIPQIVIQFRRQEIQNVSLNPPSDSGQSCSSALGREPSEKPAGDRLRKREIRPHPTICVQQTSCRWISHPVERQDT